MPASSTPHHVPDATKPVAAKPADAPRADMRVRAIKVGHYPSPGELRGRRREIGEVFLLSKMEHYSPETPSMSGWMEWAVQPPVIKARPPETTVPNRINDPMGVPAGNAPRSVDRAGEPGQVTWPDAAGTMQGSVNAVPLPGSSTVHKGLDGDVPLLPAKDGAPAQTKPEDF